MAGELLNNTHSKDGRETFSDSFAQSPTKKLYSASMLLIVRLLQFVLTGYNEHLDSHPRKPS